MQQRRLLIALILSSAILFLWTYFYSSPTPKDQQQAGATPSPSPEATANASQSATPAAPESALVANVSEAPQRTITVRTELYDVTFDTHGAEPISWILKKNKHSQGSGEIYSVAGHKSDKKPLELISPEGLKRQPRQVPLQLQTGDAAFDALLASANYRVEGADFSNGNVELNLAKGETKQLTFALDGNGFQVRKTISFNADLYQTSLSVQVKRGDALVPQVKATIGPSIGDQGITHHTFYSVAPEAVSYTGGKPSDTSRRRSTATAKVRTDWF